MFRRSIVSTIGGVVAVKCRTHRFWSEEEKCRIVAQTHTPGVPGMGRFDVLDRGGAIRLSRAARERRSVGSGERLIRVSRLVMASEFLPQLLLRATREPWRIMSRHRGGTWRSRAGFRQIGGQPIMLRACHDPSGRYPASTIGTWSDQTLVLAGLSVSVKLLATIL